MLALGGVVAGAFYGGAEAGGREGVFDGELFVEGALVGILELHEDAVVGPAQALDARGAAGGLVKGDGALEGAEVDAEVGGEVGEDGVVEVGAGGELFLLAAVADGPVAFEQGLGGGAFGFLLAFADDSADSHDMRLGAVPGGRGQPVFLMPAATPLTVARSASWRSSSSVSRWRRRSSAWMRLMGSR